MNSDKSSYSKIHSKISHLTEMQINELAKRYYNDEKVAILLNEFNINARTTELVGLFPPIVHKNEVCLYCDIYMISYRKSRSYTGKTELVCPNCNHNNSIQCSCEQCELIRRTKQQAELKHKRELIKETYSLDRVKSVEFDILNLRERIYLGALLRAGIEEDYSKIKSLSLQDAKLSPTAEMNQDIITTLFHRKIIAVHPNSPVDAFAENEKNGYPNAFYPGKVNFHINVASEDNRRQMIERIINPLEVDFIQYEKEEMLKMCKDIALQECIEYLLYSMDKVGFKYSIGENTIAVMNDLLNNFAIAQIFAIIYSAISNATRFCLEKKVARQHAANSVIGSCQRYGEKALANNWKVKRFGRGSEYKQSIISEFLFNRVLKIGSSGFDQCLSLDTININIVKDEGE